MSRPKVGDKIRSLHSFSGVPQYTVGVVVEDYDDGVTVAWDLPDRPLPSNTRPSEMTFARMPALHPLAPLRDGFGNDELDMLEVLDG